MQFRDDRATPSFLRACRAAPARPPRWGLVPVVSTLVLTLTACSSDIAGTGTTPVVSPAARAAVPATTPDGYPNVNVDTARFETARPRDAEGQQKLEKALRAAGARAQSQGRGGKAKSAVGELEKLRAQNRKAVDEIDRAAPAK